MRKRHPTHMPSARQVIASLSRLPLHPFALGAWLVLNAIVQTGVALPSTFRVWAAVFLICGLVLVLWTAVLRRPNAGALVATGSIWLLATPDLDRIWLGVIVVVAAGFAVLLAQRAARGRMTPQLVTRGANVVGVLLLLTSVVAGVANGTIPPRVGGPSTPAGEVSDRVADAGRPDIYLVILDGYPRADVFSRVTGVSNQSFLGALEARGFAVASRSHSSYMYSDLLATALFHGRHVVDIPALRPLLEGQVKPALGAQVLNEAPLVECLHSQGYLTFANAQAWDEPTLRNVDSFIDGHGLNEFERKMWWNSLPGSLMELQGPTVYQDGIEPWVHDAFATFRHVAALELERPRFAFIHVPSPHFPIVFRADGSRADAKYGLDHPAQINAAPDEVRAAYADQIAYLNHQVLEMFDDSSLPDDAVVIVMSDHGPEFGLDWFDGDRTDLRTRFGAFFAARAPAGIYDDDTNVASALVDLLRTEGLSNQEQMRDRFFVSNATRKFATLHEVPDPWHLH